MILLPWYSVSSSSPAGTLSSPATDEDGEAGVALAHAGVELGPGVVLGQPLVLGLEDDRGERRADGAADLDHGVALLAPGLVRRVAGVVGRVALRLGDLVDRVVHQLLERAPLAVPAPRPRRPARRRPRARAAGRSPCAARRPAPASPAPPSSATRAGARPPPRWRSSASSIALPSRAWIASSGFDPSSAVSVRISSSRCWRVSAQTISLIWACTESLRSVPNAAAICVGQRLGALLERVAKPAVELAQALLELAADVVDVGGGLLAVEDPAADLDRLPHGLGRGAPARPPDRAPDGRRARRRRSSRSITSRSSSARTEPSPACSSKEQLWSFGCFHVDPRR